MQQNFQSTKLPTVGASSPIGGASAWSNPSRITADDGSSASWGAFAGGQDSQITGSVFGFQQLPDNAVVDGISVFVDGSQSSAMGDIALNVSGTAWKDLGALNGLYGGATDLWGETVITPAQIAALTVTATVSDVSGGDAIASIDYISVTVYWHIDMEVAPADVPTRVAYKVYSKDGLYLGEIPNVTSKFGFSQDVNSAGSTIQITSATAVKNEVTVGAILDDNSLPIQDENDLDILGIETEIVVARGNSPDNAIFKNGNRIKVLMYNYWHPNGKLMFSGQVNNVAFSIGGESTSTLKVISDGIDLDNYYARAYPFAYTVDQAQTNQNGHVVVTQDSKGAGWHRYGQSFTTGGSTNNVGAIVIVIFGTADVTVSLYSGPNSSFIGSVTKSVAMSEVDDVQFEFPQLLTAAPNTPYFFTVNVAPGQSLDLYYWTSSVYSGGSMYESSYSGGSGGGSYAALAGDLMFVTKYGSPTTTITFTSKDPVSEVMSDVLLDYNARGGMITERSFLATGLSLTYKFIMATIFDVIKKVLELSPSGYYSYIDLGTAEIDMLPTSATADFTIVKGRDVNKLNITMSIEQVKNYLFFSGGEVTPGVNLYKNYQDTESTANYGVRIASKSDNRVTLDATANAVGNSFIEENADETQETSVTILNKNIDITLLVPGKTIGFRNFGGFVDDLVLQVVRRDFTPEAVTLTLGRLPVTMSAEVQRLNRELMLEQTVSNPTMPT